MRPEESAHKTEVTRKALKIIEKYLKNRRIKFLRAAHEGC
jgi:hypothetical protein